MMQSQRLQTPDPVHINILPQGVDYSSARGSAKGCVAVAAAFLTVSYTTSRLGVADSPNTECIEVVKREDMKGRSPAQ